MHSPNGKKRYRTNINERQKRNIHTIDLLNAKLSHREYKRREANICTEYENAKGGPKG